MEATRGTIAAASAPAKQRLRLLICAMTALAVVSGLQGPGAHGPVPLTNVKPAGFTATSLPNGGSTSSWCVNGQTPTSACGTANESFSIFGCDWYAGAGPGWDSGWSTDGDYATTDGHGCNQEAAGASDLGSDYYTENPDSGNYSNDGDGDGNSCCGDGDGRYDNSGNPETPPGDSGDISIQDGDNCWDPSDDLCGWPDFGDTTFDTGYDCSATEGCDTDYDDITGCETTPGDGCDGPGQYDAGRHWGNGAGADECGGCDTDGDVGNDGNGTDNDRWWATSYFNDAGCPVGPEYYQCALVGERAGAYVGATYNLPIFGSYSYYAGLEHVLSPTGKDQYLYCVDPGHALQTQIFDNELGYYKGAPNLPAISASNKNQIWYIAEFYGAAQHGGTFSPGIPGGAVEMYAAAQARIWALATNSTVTGFWAAGGYSVPAANSWYSTITNNAANAVASGYAPYQGAGFAPYAGSPSNAQWYFDTPTSGSGLPNPPGQIIAGGTSDITIHSTYPNGLGQSGQGATLYITPPGASGAVFTTCLAGVCGAPSALGACAGGYSCIHVTTGAGGFASVRLSAPLPGPAPTYQTNVKGISDNTDVVNPGFMIGNAAAGNNAQFQIEAGASRHEDIQNVQIDPPLFVFPPANPTFSETLHDNGTSALIPGLLTTLTQPVAPVTAVLAGSTTPGQTVYWDMNYGNNGVFSTIIGGTMQDCFGAAYDVSISSGVCSVAGNPYASGSFQLDGGSALTGTNCGGVTAPIAPPVASWCTNILPAGTNQSNRVTTTIPLTWNSRLSTELVGFPNAHAFCNFAYYHYGYTNNGSLPGTMPVNQEVCTATSYSPTITATKVATPSCLGVGGVTWSNVTPAGCPPSFIGNSDSPAGATAQYVITVNASGNRNLNGFQVADSLAGNKAFLFGYGPVNWCTPACGARAYVPDSIPSGGGQPAGPLPYSCGTWFDAWSTGMWQKDWCYWMKGTLSASPPAQVNTPPTCAGTTTCWLWADMNPATRQLTITCNDDAVSSYCNVPSGLTMNITLQSYVVYNHNFQSSPYPPTRLPNQTFLSGQTNTVNFGGSSATINPGSANASAGSLSNSVNITAPDNPGGTVSTTATSNAFLQCPPPQPGIVFTNYPRSILSTSPGPLVPVTVDVSNSFWDTLTGTNLQQGDPAFSSVPTAGATIWAPPQGYIVGPVTASGLNGSVVGAATIINPGSDGNSLQVNLNQLAGVPVGGRPQDDATITFFIQFDANIPNGIETAQAFVTAFDIGNTALGGWNNCGYPGGTAGPPPVASDPHIFTNWTASEWASDPGITGTGSTSATGFVNPTPSSQ